MGINVGGGVRLGSIRALNGTPAATPAQSTDSVNQMAGTAPGVIGTSPGHLAMYWEIGGTLALFLMYYAAPGRR